MKNTVYIIQIILSILISFLLFMQSKGTGLGRTFGSQSYHSKRGVEALVFRSTIILTVGFVVLAVVNQILI